ncbi:MAG TPA: hypothetical protein VGE27_15330 [Gemmatimonas sp.]|uniref:hypothetical protein n=1 Tax=Gemmatimonas sp. TaxID=1962908 RepID=UPI002ED8D7C4
MNAMYRVQAALAAALLMSTGCARSAFQQQVKAGQWQVAANTFQRDSMLLRDVEAVRRVARIHSMPDSATWDPGRALELLRASRLYMGTEKVPEGDLRLEQLLQLILQERDTHRIVLDSLRDSLRQQSDTVQRMRAEQQRLESASTATEGERVLLQRLVARLETDLREREVQIATLRSELERLKAIDLSRPSRPASSPVPIIERPRERGVEPPGR